MHLCRYYLNNFIFENKIKYVLHFCKIVCSILFVQDFHDRISLAFSKSTENEAKLDSPTDLFVYCSYKTCVHNSTLVFPRLGIIFHYSFTSDLIHLYKSLNSRL
jgi:hypothetical protein